jgi:truncated hemoglobin YjbI
MHAAVGESGMSAEHQQQFWEYVSRAAHFLVNTFEDEPPVARTSLL